MAVPRMMQSKRWVVQEHSGSRVAHDRFDFFFHIWLVAVDETFAARAFFVLKWALIKPQKSIFFELRAFGAEHTIGSMVVFAVNINHVAYGFLFTLHSFVIWVRRLPLHFKSS